MSEKVILKFKAEIKNPTASFIEDLNMAVHNSMCRILDSVQVPSGALVSTIRVTSDKIQRLYESLKQTGLLFSDDYTLVVQNAQEQYSVFREIELELSVFGLPEGLLKNQQASS